ncbi:hypothetical protein Ciccas_009885 [Cichlidogyrus casuarinus]|uniref:Uncharacterized protein n=1 Tax=Cichlidogyrus casuarinus TaxID=1844966 RepID=A0ABD2PWS1_9PLAT
MVKPFSILTVLCVIALILHVDAQVTNAKFTAMSIGCGKFDWPEGQDDDVEYIPSGQDVLRKEFSTGINAFVDG